MHVVPCRRGDSRIARNRINGLWKDHRKTIRNIPERYKATVDRYVIMPNHIHLIIIITDDEELRAIRESPLRGRSVISKVIGYVKMNASKEIHGKYDDAVIWQRGFHDHIIRNR